MQKDRIAWVHKPLDPCDRRTYEAAVIRHVAGYYNHAARICWLNGREVVLEAKGSVNGVIEPVLLEDWLAARQGQEIHYQQARVTLTEEEIQYWIGKKYDYAAALWHLAYFNATGIWIGRVALAEEKVICFELVFWTEGIRDWYRHLPVCAIEQRELAPA